MSATDGLPTSTALETVAQQAPLSMGFSRQEYWSGLPCPPPGDLPDPGIEPESLTSPALAETRYCYTQHTMEVTGNSISVTKRCVPLEDCLSTGCRDSEHEGHKVCTSCCEGNICNLPLPRNETDATFATTSPINQTNGHPHCMSVIVSCLWVWLGLTL
uniref:LY6/PLAUR domain containing 6 n=1 Tax=Bos taurus TaxID=9913 RepID=G3N0Q5_BOVIN